ncbi:uncharacterized protein LOC110437580 [Sorghum bicolor]|uniref:uncharacterized protein LOC110437580 n=1 Tax=Sorghum bicolor TaxID=4558 RepID=UPI000B42684A|nr:uncharacterized protein LOC110437580 [Sorghum bicolor]|eukprot:XP_021321727.1 uncharacterized protein LOC110437580 [Sorghum bicolor]
MYAGRRVGADIRAAMVGGDGRRGGGLCAACSEDGVGIGYRIGDCGSMPSDSHWLATMDGGGGGHGPSPWSGHRGRGGAGKARTGAGGAGGVGGLDGGAAGGAADGAAGEAVDDTTERRDGGPTFAWCIDHYWDVIANQRIGKGPRYSIIRCRTP